MSDVTPVLDARAELGEGPIWDPEGQQVIWVDILKGLVHLFDPAASSDRTIAVGQPVGAVALRRSGGLVLAMRDGFGLLNLATGRADLIAAVEADRPANRMNDGKCDPAGRFFAGTMALDEKAGAGTLYRLDRDRSVRPVLRGVTISNGLDWSPDNRLMYYVDSPTQRVDVFDYDVATGSFTTRRPFVQIDPSVGAPDGLSVDAEGGVWVVLWGGGAVHRYAPDGRLDRRITVPASNPTGCTFGGPDLMDLYITSSTMGLSRDRVSSEPHAGGLFRCRPGVAGRRSHQFAG